MFRPFKRSSSGLLTDPVNRYCVHVAIPIIYVKQNYFIIHGYMFRPFKRSSSGLLTDPVNRYCVHVAIPIIYAKKTILLYMATCFDLLNGHPQAF